jgi:hypothetical protein
MGRFVLGFVVGAAVGAVVTAALMQPPDDLDRLEPYQRRLPGSLGEAEQQMYETSQSLVSRVRSALDEGRIAAAAHERQMWNQFRARLEQDGESENT